MNFPGTCVGKEGRFIVGVHKPSFHVKNLRDREHYAKLGELEDGTAVENQANFPKQDLFEPQADIIYEIANPFPFRGATFINSAWANAKADHPETICIPSPEPCSLIDNIAQAAEKNDIKLSNPKDIIDLLPHPLLIALAQASTDPEELIRLAKKSCRILFDPETCEPNGIGYKKNIKGNIVPDIFDHELFEVLVNNRFLPDTYKNTLVLKPGVQGNNEITGEYLSEDGHTHVFEYLRRNSYIPWGHFASNMANDAIRYRARDLKVQDMAGIRHLYYQRAYVRIAGQLNIPEPEKRKMLTPEQLETLRQKIMGKISGKENPNLEFDCTLWGWNYGFGYAQSGHRLHASHQMIHQQNAMIPSRTEIITGGIKDSFACGDLISEFVCRYRETINQSFFKNYIKAIKSNTRTDGRMDLPESIILLEDENTLLFVPKAQICEWELQLISKKPCGNILEADTAMRDSLDKAILTAVKTLDLMGAQFVTSIEFSKRFGNKAADHHIVYSFIPRLPYAPDTFSEAQLRWISGCYPEDVAQACRKIIQTIA